MKRIYISDVVHEHLKKEAKRQGRTLQWLVEDKLTVDTPVNVGAPSYGKVPLEQALSAPVITAESLPNSSVSSFSAEKNKDLVLEYGKLYSASGERVGHVISGSPIINPKRSKSEILKDIDAQKLHIADLENQTQINQDPDLLEMIKEEKDIYDALWKEYNELKDDK